MSRQLLASIRIVLACAALSLCVEWATAQGLPPLPDTPGLEVAWQDTEGTWALRLYVKPWIRLIWLGSLFMALGGFIVAFDQRFRRKGPA